jgi:hypothetical protein
VTAAAHSLSVRVKLTIRRRGGRKIVVMPEGEVPTGPAPARDRIDPTLVKALARAHRWKRLLESGRYASISEMAAAEKIDRGYLGRILLLTLLAPDIVEAILDGRQPKGLGLPDLLKPFPLLWERQRSTWLIAVERAQAAACVSSQPQRRAPTPMH